MRAALYGRYSSDNQRAESIDAQLRACRQYCEENGHMVVKIYKDEAISGTSDQRDEFLQMIEDSKKDLFDVVIVHKLDRFARNRYDSAIYRKKLKDNGVKLISVIENFDENNPESVLLMSIIEGYNEFYSLNLAREVRKGQKENALKGIHNGGIPPLGFDLDENKKLVVNPEEAEAVKLIFEMFTRGYGYGMICNELNNNGYRTKVGNKFTKTAIADLLRNEKYIGHHVFNKRLSKKTGNRIYKDEKDIVKLENHYPAIIDLETWNRKEEIVNARVKPRKNHKRHFYLTGKAICGCCDGHFAGTSGTGGRNKTKYYFYQSINRARKVKDCKCKNIRADLLEELTFNLIKERILNDALIEDLAIQVREKLLASMESDKKLISALEKKKTKIEARIDKLLDLHLDGTLTKEALKNKTEQFQDELTDVIIKLNDLNGNAPNVPTVKKIKVSLEEMKKNLESEDQDLKQIVIDTFVDKIVIGEDDVDIYLVVNPYVSTFRPRSAKVNGDGASLTLVEHIYKGDFIPKYKRVNKEE